ncbi:hypothetical protein NFI96_034251 [Prochilodus magdalenae]|nr:hypothetical protein NFI96_034251 [Prochilodus magdalenae]
MVKETKDPPKPEVILTSGWSKTFPGEKVILTCTIPDGSTGWIYSWSKDSQSIPGESGKTLTISPIKQSDHGTYTCQTELTNRPRSIATSAGYSLTVSDPPKLNVNLTSGWNKVFPGEEVILTCKTSDGSTGWIYSWSRNSQSIPDPPKLNVNLTSGWNKAFPGEKVILTCTIPDGSTDWTYSWSRNSQSIPGESGKTLTISSIKQSDHGTYACQTELTNRPSSRATSAGYSLRVSDPPKLNVNLTSGWNQAFPGEEVNLTCKTSDGSTGWIYLWSRNSQSISGDANVNTLTISPIKQSDNGTYTCQTELKNRPRSRATSAGYSLTVVALPLALLTLETSLSDIMSVEVLTLKCEIKDDKHGWNYTWYKDGVFQVTIQENTYTVMATEDSFKSEYKCIGKRTERPLYSSFSDTFKANNIVLKRKVLLAISGCVVGGIFLLIIGCILLRCTRKTDKQETMKEDLFFSMKDSKIQTTSPLQEYLTENGPPPNKKECDESTVLLNVAVPVVAEENKEESKETAGFTSFKVEKSPQDKDESSKECDESTETVPAVKDEIKVEA